MRPVFLFSLPRSGSTLAQRVMAAHPDIATTSEPWILLPLMSTLRPDLGVAEYGQRQAVKAVHEFLSCLEDGESYFRSELRELVLGLYARVGGDAPYFLDKTPRYHLIAQDLIHLFPDAKFVFLWRNPLAVVASIVSTWPPAMRWNVYRYYVDLYKGLENLVDAQGQVAASSVSLRYEDMVADPEATFRRLFAYLDLEFDAEFLSAYPRVALKGSMGDPDDLKKYKGISQASLHNWPSAFCNPLRRRWARQYVRWIGEERLASIGYDEASLVAGLDSTSHGISKLHEDVPLFAWAAMHAPLDLPGMRVRIARSVRRRRNFART